MHNQTVGTTFPEIVMAKGPRKRILARYAMDFSGLDDRVVIVECFCVARNNHIETNRIVMTCTQFEQMVKWFRERYPDA